MSEFQLKNKEVRIEPTNLCNYECVMCPRERLTRRRGIMSMSDYKQILDELVTYGVKKITLTGFGEPFIDFTLELKIKLAADYGLETYVITNASLFHMPSRYDKGLTQIEACIKNGLTELRLSFYGLNQKDYERIMVKGNYDQVMKNLELLKTARARFGTSRLSTVTHQHITCPEVSMYFLDMGDNLDFEKFKALAASVVDYYEVWKPHNFGNGRSYRDLGAAKQSCGRPQNGPIQINYNGVIVPCCYDYNDNIVLGNILQNTLVEILRGDAYKELRDVHNTGDFARQPYCNSCDQLLVNKAQHSFVISTNPKHANLAPEDIVKRTNTSPEMTLI